MEIQSCFADGGIFGMVIPPVVLALLALELLWLGMLAVKELKRRSDLARIRDLVIEGSVGQAILYADLRKDAVVEVCRAGIVAVQGSGNLEEAQEKVDEAARTRFGKAPLFSGALFLVLLLLVPVGLAIGSRFYAEVVVRAAAARVPEGERAALNEAAESDPAVVCPPRLGLTGMVALVPAAAAILLLVRSRRSTRTRAESVRQAMGLAEMASRVSSHRAYQGQAARAG